MSEFLLADTSSGLIDFFSTTDIAASAIQPRGICFTSSLNLYWTDSNSAIVYNTTTDGSSLINSFNFTTSIDSQATKIYGVACSSGNNLFITENVKNKVYHIKSDGGSLYGSIDVSAVDSSANNPLGISYTSSNNLFVLDSTTKRIYNITTDASSLINMIQIDNLIPDIAVPSGLYFSNSATLQITELLTNHRIFEIFADGSAVISIDRIAYVDSSELAPTDITKTNSANSYIIGDTNDKIYDVILENINHVSITPEYDYEFINNMVSRQDTRTKTGKLYTYIEDGRFKRFEIPLSWVNSSDVSQINSWWELGINLKFSENSDFPNSYHEVRIMGEEDPFNSFVRPYFQEFYSGEIILETI